MAYAVIIRVQGSSLLDPRVLFVSMLIAATAVLAGSQPSADGQIRLVCGAAATGGLLGAGVVGIYSIGLPLLVAGVFAAPAWARPKKTVASRPPSCSSPSGQRS